MNNTGVRGQSTGGRGVYGVSTSSNGVHGDSQSQGGVLGTSASSDGVLGVSTNGPGVRGYSPNSVGVRATSGANHAIMASTAAANAAGIYSYADSANAYAGSFGGRVLVNAPSGFALSCTASGVNAAAVYGVATAAGGVGVYGYSGGADWAGYFSGNVGVTGSLTVGSLIITGAKSAAVPHPDGSHRLLYCVESPEAWFEDYGDATLAGGAASVPLDPDFAAVSDMRNYRVFVSAYGDSKGLYVASRTAAGFVVREQGGGTSNTAFSWRVVAKRKDIPGPRLAKVDMPKAVSPPAMTMPLAAPMGAAAAVAPMLPPAPTLTAPPMQPPSASQPTVPATIKTLEAATAQTTMPTPTGTAVATPNAATAPMSTAAPPRA